MVYIKGAALDQEQSKNPDPVYTGSTGTKSAGGYGKVFHCLPASSVPDAPMPIKSPRTSVLLDAKTICSIASEGVFQGKSELLTADAEKISDHNESFLHLNRPLLVRLKLLRHAGEMIKAVCDSRDIGRKGVKLSLPCHLDLRAGCIINMELFMSHGEDPVCIRGEVRKVARCQSEDLIRYEVSVDFDPMNSSALSRISGFIQASEAKKYQQLPA